MNGRYVQLSSDMMVRHNCDHQTPSDKQVAGGAHNLVFVMGSSDGEELISLCTIRLMRGYEFLVWSS